VRVLLTGRRGGPARRRGGQHERLPGDPPEPFAAERLRGAAAIVDALLGTGFAASPASRSRVPSRRFNATDAVVVAADVPSGVDASTGVVAGAAVRARATATFHAAKPGCGSRPARRTRARCA